MHHPQTLGHVVRELREMASKNASPAEMRAFLEDRNIPFLAMFDYLGVAFLQPSNEFLYTMSTREAAEGLKDEIGKLITQNRQQWELQRFPELMRIRDYFAFSQFAGEQGLTVMVCAANRSARRYIGRPGFDCYEGRTFVVSAETGPHAGLVAADPTDPRLHAALQAFPHPMLYDEYVARLHTDGKRVLGAEEGWAVATSQGHRLYEGYRLHGVYDADGESVWRGREGERLRGILNRHLGAELVRFGPHDDWEHRNNMDIAGPLYGPQLPVVVFEPEGQIDNFLTSDVLVSTWSYGDRWSRRYPHPVDESGGAR